ncbi:MAG: hypothetical protein R3B70_32510 [Polyangiaceae bacterium]
MIPRPFVLAVTTAAALLSTTAALADDGWSDGSTDKLPPDDRPARKKDDAKAVDPSIKDARFLADLKLGPAFVLTARGVTEFSLQINFGYAVARDLATADDAFYLTVSPYMLVGEDLTLVTPLGAQYEMPLKMIPYQGISAYARVSVGYAYYKPPLLDFDKGYHGLAVQPALGAKLAVGERFHVGIEPFAFDITTVFPPASVNSTLGTVSAFQLYIFGGARF